MLTRVRVAGINGCTHYAQISFTLHYQHTRGLYNYTEITLQTFLLLSHVLFWSSYAYTLNSLNLNLYTFYLYTLHIYISI